MNGITWNKCVLLFILVLVAGMLGNFDIAEEYHIEAEEKMMRPARVMSMPAQETWWTMLEPSGNSATFDECSWASLTINHDPCYSNQPCALRRICYGDASRWLQL